MIYKSYEIRRHSGTLRNYYRVYLNGVFIQTFNLKKDAIKHVNWRIENNL